MLSGLLLAAALGGWVPAVPAVVVALIWWQPLLVLPVLGVAAVRAVRTRQRSSHDELVAAWLRAATSELRSGRSLRSAVVGAVEAIPELGLGRVARLAAVGRPLEEVAGAMAGCRGMGAVAVVLMVASQTGGSVVPVLDALTGEAVDEATLERERRSLTVAARLSIAIIGGFPLAVLVAQVLRGEVGRMFRSGSVAVAIVLVGMTLLIAGLVIVAVLMQRTRH